MIETDLPQYGDWHTPLPPWLHREMALVGGALYTVGGLIVLLPLVLDESPPNTPWLVLAVAVIAVAVGTFFVWDANRRPLTQAQYVTATGLGAVLIGLAVYGGGASLAAIFGALYMFVSAYAFYYYPDWVAASEVAVGAVGYAVALTLIDAPSAELTWITVTVSAVLSGALTARLGRHVRSALIHERKANEMAEAASQAKTGLLQTVSHDLRAPLASMIGLLETAVDPQRGQDPALREELLQRSLAGAKRMLRLLEDLLDIERLRAGDVMLRAEPVRLDRLVMDTLSGIDFDHHRSRTDLSEVVADVEPARLSRVVENLISNAVRHTAPGTTVTVTVRDHGAKAEIVVEDDGPGIPDAQRDELFTAFGTSSREDGSGLGLSLAAQFTHLHGGTIEYEDRPGGGARFVVSLPRHGDPTV